MESLSFIILAALFICAALVIFSQSSNKRKVFKNNKYGYLAKTSLMTRSEGEFFIKLNQIVSDRYFVFPQVHLSSIFDHRMKGQEWAYAFRHINGKSVDYVLCDRETLRPTYAIELDDYTHDKSDRRERDTEVERIFAEAQLPLVRFRSKDVSEAEVIQTLTEAKKLLNS